MTATTSADLDRSVVLVLRDDPGRALTGRLVSLGADGVTVALDPQHVTPAALALPDDARWAYAPWSTVAALVLSDPPPGTPPVRVPVPTTPEEMTP